MTAALAIRELLVGATPLTALCPASNIMVGVVPQKVGLPSISIEHISTTPISHIDAQADYNLVTSRVQVTVLAAEYMEGEAVLAAVRKACNYQRGTLAGLGVVNILRDLVGPDVSDEKSDICFKSIDFMVTFNEPN